ncbi:MAG: protein kinase [Myxococcales bacterium]|nr:protein kinase [Myxococcales bacterium]
MAWLVHFSGPAIESLGSLDMTKLGEFPASARFERIRLAGEGSFGVVYEAFDRERGASVAMKVLREEPAGDAVLRFKSEFRGLRELQHPNVVKLHELVHEGGQWFLPWSY